VLFHLGIGRPNGNPHTNCSAGVTHGSAGVTHGTASDQRRAFPPVTTVPPPPISPNAPLLPSVSWSTSPTGPWHTQNGTRDGWALNNPAAYFWPHNGSVLMLYKAQCDEDPHGHSFCRQFAVANCVTFRGPCTPLRKIPIYGACTCCRIPSSLCGLGSSGAGCRSRLPLCGTVSDRRIG
jgi:hypothetical protein